jgi:hypothetical protein
MVDALRRDDPEPWRYVQGWTDGKARDAGNARVVESVVMAVFLNGLTWPMAYAALSTESDGPLLFAFVALPLIGLWAALRAVRAIRHRRLHGETIFNMDTFPGVVGESLAGTVLIRMDPTLAREVVFTVTLTCRRRIEQYRAFSAPTLSAGLTHLAIPPPRLPPHSRRHAQARADPHRLGRTPRPLPTPGGTAAARRPRRRLPGLRLRSERRRLRRSRARRSRDGPPVRNPAPSRAPQPASTGLDHPPAAHRAIVSHRGA